MNNHPIDERNQESYHHVEERSQEKHQRIQLFTQFFKYTSLFFTAIGMGGLASDFGNRGNPW